MTQKNVVALCRITMSDQDSPLEFTGRFDSQGNPVMRKSQFSVRAGELFGLEETHPDLQRLLEQGFIRLASPDEVAAGHAGPEQCVHQPI